MESETASNIGASPVHSFAELEAATNNFSLDSRIGVI